MINFNDREIKSMLTSILIIKIVNFGVIRSHLMREVSLMCVFSP